MSSCATLWARVHMAYSSVASSKGTRSRFDEAPSRSITGTTTESRIVSFQSFSLRTSSCSDAAFSSRPRKTPGKASTLLIWFE